VRRLILAATCAVRSSKSRTARSRAVRDGDRDSAWPAGAEAGEMSRLREARCLLSLMAEYEFAHHLLGAVGRR